MTRLFNSILWLISLEPDALFTLRVRKISTTSDCNIVIFLYPEQLHQCVNQNLVMLFRFVDTGNTAKVGTNPTAQRVWCVCVFVCVCGGGAGGGVSSRGPDRKK